MTRLTESEYSTLIRNNPDLVERPGMIMMKRPEPAGAREYRTRHNIPGIVPTEDEEQRAVIAWADANTGKYPELHLLYHIPNGGARNPATGALLKAAGVRAGVPDLHLPCARNGDAGLWIEMKRSDHSNASSAQQKVWIAALRREGHRVVVCYGAGAAITALEEYLS